MVDEGFVREQARTLVSRTAISVRPMYSSLRLSDLDGATLDAWQSTGIVFLVGSYVSTFPPTNLPTGSDTTQALWQRILRKADLDFLRTDLSDVPFEAIMQCYPDRTAIQPIIRKLFCITEPNPVHQCLVSSLRSGKSKGLITTNYDLGFDSALAGDQGIITIFDQAGFDRYRSLYTGPGIRPKPYFKIHGTAAPGGEETIVCDLEAEGWLRPWKRELLSQMIEGRTLVLIGYSGSDFDLCPELAESTRQAHTVWLQPSLGHVKANAKRVLDRTAGVVVIGDLIEFLNVLLKEDLTALPWAPRPADLDDFDPALTDEWRLEILNWIGCARLLYQSLNNVKRKGPAFRRALYGHSGRYGDVVRQLEAEPRSSPSSAEERLRQRIDLACARFIYGEHLRAWRMLNQVDQELLSLTSASEDLRTRAIEARMVVYMRAAQVARALHLTQLQRYIRGKACQPYSMALKSLQELGAWGRLEALQQNAERIGIAKSDALPLPARRGYRSLGLVSMHIITQRDWFRAGRWRLSAAKERGAIEGAAKAKAYGWHHEAWKLNWILLFRGHGKKWHYFREWLKHFRATQYPPLARVFQLFINLVPTGEERDFEDERYWH